MPLSRSLEPALLVLRRVKWLADAREDTLLALAEAARRESHAAGAVLMQRGRPAHHLLIVESGVLVVSVDHADGRRYVVSLSGPGEAMALIPLIDGGPIIHDVCCRGFASVLLVPRDAVLEALQSDVQLLWRVTRLLSARSRRQYEGLVAQHLLDLPARVVHVLRTLFYEARQLELEISQSELAEILRATRQSVNGELRRLAADGVLHLGRGRITLLDAAALDRAAGPSL